MLNQEVFSSECVNILTYTHSKCTVEPVIVADIERDLVRQYEQDRKRIKQNGAEMKRLYDAWMRYRDLEKNNRELLERMSRIIAAVGKDQFADNRSSGKEAAESFDQVAVVVGDEPLWKAIAAIVEVRPGIQVVELHHALDHFGYKTSRSAIESALATHKNEFVTTTRGRRKFVSLKGA